MAESPSYDLHASDAGADHAWAAGFLPAALTAARGRVHSPETLSDAVYERVWRALILGEWDRFVGGGAPYRINCPNLPPGDGSPAAATSVGSPRAGPAWATT